MVLYLKLKAMVFENESLVTLMALESRFFHVSSKWKVLTRILAFWTGICLKLNDMKLLLQCWDQNLAMKLLLQCLQRKIALFPCISTIAN